MGKKNKTKKIKIPSSDDWIRYENDLDLKDLHKLIYGKKVEEVYYYFKNGAYISRADELLHSNKKVFQYYIYAFALYLIFIGQNDVDAEDGFLRLLINREKTDKGSVYSIYCIKNDFEIIDESFNTHKFSLSLKSVVENIEERFNQEKIDNEIYDDIPKLLNNIKAIMN